MAATTTSTDGYTLLKTINLPGTIGGHGDWVAYDSDTKSIWIAESPTNNIVVLDATTNQIKAVIPNFSANANVVAFTPNYAFVTDPVNNVTEIYDKRSLQLAGVTQQTGTSPDGAAYVSSTNQVYVSSDDANVIDALSATPTFAQQASITLSPNPSTTGPDVPTYSPEKDRIFQPNQGSIDVINPKTNTILNVFNLLTTGAVKPVVYDPVTNHLIAGTTTNQVLIVNADTGALLSTIPISGGTDQVAIDVANRRAYFGDKAGVVDVINLDTNTLVGDLPAEKNMHTLTVDPTTHDVYVYENNSNKIDIYAPASSVATASTSTASVTNGVANLTAFASFQAAVQSSSGATTVRISNQLISAGSANQIAFVDGTLDVGASSPAATIIRLYAAGLGRTPSASEIRFWNTIIQSGASTNDVAQGIVTSKEGQSVFANAQSGTAFINQVYQNIFHRAADAGGVTTWTQVLAAGGAQGQAQVLAGIANSAEAQSTTAAQIKTGVFINNDQATQVERLYYTALDRNADAGGLSNYVNALNGGATLASVAQAMVNSPEFANVYGSYSAAQFVTALYQNVLGRAPDAGGFATWTNGLNNGTLTKAAVVLGFSQSAERASYNIETQGISLTSNVPVST
ncbi:MAG: hypothetical protein NVSMB18_26900 [Acetobacteraceae bacterium]